MGFADLHRRGGAPFVLPNAWDVPSALAYVAAGFTAVGTTSFGVSSSHGHRDGGRATGDANVALAAALAPLKCFVSVDIEDGYSDDPDVVADYVASLPIAGINIEDSTGEKLIELDAAAAKITAIKRRNPDVFINARVDTYWLNQQANPATTIERALHYVDAGADGDLRAIGQQSQRTGGDCGRHTATGEHAAGRGSKSDATRRNRSGTCIDRIDALQRRTLRRRRRGPGGT